MLYFSKLTLADAEELACSHFPSQDVALQRSTVAFGFGTGAESSPLGIAFCKRGGKERKVTTLPCSDGSLVA